MATAKLTYSGDLVRKHDPDRFLASLFVPHDRRQALWDLYAFNYEIARTREVVSNTTLGLIRLQWWRDAFRGIYEKGEILPHEVVRGLAQAIKAHDLPHAWFEGVLNGREFDLEDAVPTTLEGLDTYADATGTPLLKLALKIAGEDDAQAAEIAKAYSLAGLLRAAPFHASQRRCYLPSAVMAAHGMDAEALYAGRPEGLQGIIRDVALHARALLPADTGKGRLKAVTAMQARLILNQLKFMDYDVFDARMGLQPPFYALRLWWTGFLAK